MDVVHKGQATETINKLPAPPRWYGKAQKEAYNRTGKILISAQLLKRKHLPTLEIFAINYAQWQAAIQAINKANNKKAMSGYVQTYATGAKNVTPEVTLKEKAEKQLFTCIKRFGLDPKSEKELGEDNQLALFDIKKLVNS